MILADAHAILQRMLDPMSLDAFLGDVLGKRFIKLEAGNSGGCRDLLGEHPQRTILQAYARLAPGLGCHAAAPLGPPPVPGPVPDADGFRTLIAEYHARGYTVRVQHIRSVSDELRRFLRALELTFQAPVRAEAFWSRADGRAPVHYDDDDIIVIQLAGRKRWFISTEPSHLPNGWKSVFDSPPRLEHWAEIEVEPGDMLYLPRGTVHRVDSLTESLHASIGFVPVTLRETVLACLDLLSDTDRTLRDTVGQQGGVPPRVQSAVEALLARCGEDGFVAEALRHRAGRVIGNLQKLDPPGPPRPLSLYTRLRHRDLAGCHLVCDETKIDFAYPGGHQYFPRSVEESLDFVASTPVFRILDLPGPIGDDLRLALAGKLIACGFLEIADG